jgi:Asp-tRNA(Asn)/Glu-tRNA(Gln) amidotransferase A subunit family amidase
VVNLAHLVRHAPSLLRLSASRLAALVRSQTVTSEQIVWLFLDHLAKVNPHLNASVVSRRAQALSRARAADDRYRLS